MKIVIRTPRYERLSTRTYAFSGVTPFLGVERMRLIRTVSLELKKIRGGNGIKVKCLEMGSEYPPP